MMSYPLATMARITYTGEVIVAYPLATETGITKSGWRHSCQEAGGTPRCSCSCVRNCQKQLILSGVYGTKVDGMGHSPSAAGQFVHQCNMSRQGYC